MNIKKLFISFCTSSPILLLTPFVVSCNDVTTNEKRYTEEDFKKSIIDESYKAVFEELKNEQPAIKHWVGFFKGHSWDWLARRLQSYSLNLLAVADLVLQLAPAIAAFIQYGDTQVLVDAFSSFEGKLSSFSQWLFIKGVEDLRNWKINTKCKSKFYIWGQTL